MPYDASNPRHVRKAEKQSRAFEASASLYLQHAMATVEGRAWFYALLGRCHIYHNPYSGDALNTAFTCGEMNIGQQILAEMMTSCPEQYLQMIREHSDGGRTSTSTSDRHSRDREDTGRADNGSGGGGVISEYEPNLFDSDADRADAD